MDGVDGEEELAGPSRLPPLMKWLAGGAALAAVAIIGVQLTDGAGFGAVSSLDRPCPVRTGRTADGALAARGRCLRLRAATHRVERPDHARRDRGPGAAGR